MECRLIQQDRRGSLVLEGELTIHHALDMKQALLSVLAQSESIEISLAGVTEMDTAGAQLLLMIKREAEEQGVALRLKDHTSAVRTVVDTMQLAGTLGDPMLIPGEAADGDHP
jgi:anti-anti-sigma factor